MGTGIQGSPNDYDFGYDFDYSIWPINTTIDLVNVPWNNDYRDVVKFANKTALDAYIDSKTPAGTRVSQLSYVKPNMPVRLDIPFNAAIKYNYLRASNPLQPVSPSDVSKKFYYFVIDVRYIAPNTTELILQLDVWQTYVYDVTFGNCYVERGHIGIANENAFDNYGRDYLTVPEGLDIGSNLQVITHKTRWTLSPTPAGLAESPTYRSRYPGYDVLVASTIDIQADPGDVENPNLITAPGGQFQGLPSGAAYYIFSSDNFLFFLHNFKDKPWVTQGIISITMVPRMKRYYPYWEYAELAAGGDKAPTQPPQNPQFDMFEGWRTNSEIINYIPAKYRHLSKLFTSPYCVIEMTSFTGTPVILKPELWNSPDATIQERVGLIPPAQRLEYSPVLYNSLKNSVTETDKLWPLIEWEGDYAYANNIYGDDYGEYLDVVTQIANFPTMALVNSGALSYLASNTHGIAFSQKSADWTQQRALGMAQGSYDVASGAIQANKNQTDIANIGATGQTAVSNKNVAEQAGLSALGNVTGSASMGTAFGGVRGGGGMVGSALASEIFNGFGAQAQMANSELATQLANSTRSADTAIQNQQGQLVRDTNKNLADWAARGDYANAIAGINAKVQDAELIPPTTSGQIGGETINIVNGGLRLSLRWRMIDQSTIRAIGDYWLRYGYAIRSFIKMPASLMVMTKFTYWKLTETYLVNTNIPEGFKQAIRGIFEKGVTVWANPADIGNIDIADNDPIAGVTY